MATSEQGGVAVSVAASVPNTNPSPTFAPFSPGALPLTSVNHISFAVPSPRQTADFFHRVLGFKRLPRPQAFEETFDGAWVCGMGLEIHFIQPTPDANPRRHTAAIPAEGRKAIDPRSDHLSFLCRRHPDPRQSDWHRVVETLKRCDVDFLERSFPGDNLRQVS